MLLYRTVRARSKRDDSKFSIRICSRNNFPTAAGLASSAAGYACLVYALGSLFGIEDKAELCQLARMGSGSAIRSIFGGYVQWIAGDNSDNSVATQIVDHKYWPQVRVLVLVVNDEKKETGSTLGMQNSYRTSTLIHHRAQQVVPKRISDIKEAILKRDFNTFAEITMKDSNQFHAIAQDTWPPIRYMSDTSWEVVRLVHSLNEHYGTNKIAYTFDAGPNACLYLLEDVLPDIFAALNEFFPNDVELEYVRGQPAPAPIALSEELIQTLQKRGNRKKTNSFKYLINTSIGDGPQIVSGRLLTDAGLPVN